MDEKPAGPKEKKTDGLRHTEIVILNEQLFVRICVLMNITWENMAPVGRPSNTDTQIDKGQGRHLMEGRETRRTEAKRVTWKGETGFGEAAVFFPFFFFLLVRPSPSISGETGGWTDEESKAKGLTRLHESQGGGMMTRRRRATTGRRRMGRQGTTGLPAAYCVQSIN